MRVNGKLLVYSIGSMVCMQWYLGIMYSDKNTMQGGVLSDRLYYYQGHRHGCGIGVAVVGCGNINAWDSVCSCRY